MGSALQRTYFSLHRVFSFEGVFSGRAFVRSIIYRVDSSPEFGFNVYGPGLVHMWTNRKANVIDVYKVNLMH